MAALSSFTLKYFFKSSLQRFVNASTCCPSNSDNFDFIEDCTIIIVVNGNLTIVEFLCSKGASTHVNDDDDTLLSLAASLGHGDIFNFLLSEGANIYASKGSALKLAAASNHLEIVKSWIEKSKEINPPKRAKYIRAAIHSTSSPEIKGYLKERMKESQEKKKKAGRDRTKKGIKPTNKI